MGEHDIAFMQDSAHQRWRVEEFPNLFQDWQQMMKSDTMLVNVDLVITRAY